MKILPINNGYYNFKSIENQIFKSRYQKSLCSSVKTTNDILEWDKNTYVIGEGNFDISHDKTQNNTTKILMLNMLSRFTDEEESFNLLLSTPPMMFKQQSVALKDFLKGYYLVKHNNKTKRITINNVKVYPETFIIYLNYQEKYKNKNLLIIDIGGYTTNICRVSKGSFSAEDYATLSNGMYHLDTEIAQFLSSKPEYISYNFSADDIQYLRDTNDEILIKEAPYIDEIYNNFVKKIVDQIQLKKWNHKIYEVLCTGGGSTIVFDNIHLFIDKSTLSSNPIFDNLNALEKLVKLEERK